MVLPKASSRGSSYWKGKLDDALRSFLKPRQRLLLCVVAITLYLWIFFWGSVDTESYAQVERSHIEELLSENKLTESRHKKIGNQLVNATTVPEGAQQDAVVVSTEWKLTNETQFEVCFLTSVYSSSITNADRPPSVTDIRKDNPSFQFFAFTNLEQLVAPGWHVIVKQFPDYRRYITQSRWPKFMAWQHPLVRQCQAVFYMDGFCGPKAKHSERYKRLAQSIATSEFGLFQNVHDVSSGPIHELDRIVQKRKDIAKNVEASKEWLRSQPDFFDNCTMYANHYIAYDPKSLHFQQAASFFWDRYSMEEDSWRDQPLWCYVLDHFKITPTRLGTFEALFRDYFNRMGHGGHRYTNEADSEGNADNRQRSMAEWEAVARNTTSAEVCFVTASYASSADEADRPPGVRKFLEANPTARFYVFTNIPELDAPGWKVLVQTFPEYQRHITQSRWPKFLGWKHPLIRNSCQTVFYLDAYCRPRDKFGKRFQKVAEQISNSPSGLAQDLHQWGMGPITEFERILEKGKDSRAHVDASIEWLRSQPDFNDNCTLYSNQYIAYNPSNHLFQQASQFFWDHYSLEGDSWRDQPLWCYVLDHFNMVPFEVGSLRAMFKEHKTRMSPGSHIYVNSSKTVIG